MRLHLYLSHIWQLLYLHFASIPDAAPSEGEHLDRLKVILGYIQEHFSEPITLEDIAGSVNICRSECCRFFKKHMRESLFDYLLNYRIEQSLACLSKSDCSITEAAIQCGFSTPSYFSRVFRDRMGYTPGEYRRLALRR